MQVKNGGLSERSSEMNKAMGIWSIASHKLGVCRHILLCNYISLFRKYIVIANKLLLIAVDLHQFR